MSRYIDAETLKVSILRYAKKLISHKRLPITKSVAEEVINDVCFAIDVMKAEDVIPVVRCKDCRYGEVDDKDFPDQYLCLYHGCDWNNGDHFCGRGEKVSE